MHNCGVTKVGSTTLGAWAHKLDHYPFRQRALSVQKNEKITRTAQILKLNSTQFTFQKISTMDIKKFLEGGGPGGWARGWLIFFLHITILFHQYNDKNIICEQFYCCLHYIFYTQFILLCFEVFFPSPEKLQLFCKKSIFSYIFWPRWL